MEIDYLEQNSLNDKDELEKNKHNEEVKERYRSIRMYTKVTSMIGNLVGTILLGIIVGYFVSKYTEKDIWMAICIIAFSIFGIVDFYIRVVKFK